MTVTPGDRQTPWRAGLRKLWRIAPLKSVAEINRYKLPESTDPNLQILYVDIRSVDSRGRFGAVESVRFGQAPSRARRLPRRGDTIVSTVRTYLRAIAHVEDLPTQDTLVCSTGFAVLSATPKLHHKFLFYWMSSSPVVDEICARSVGVSYPAINPPDFSGLPISVPPLDVQRAIADFLDRKTAAIDALIDKKERLLALLQEKRQALITQAVTKGLDPNVPMKDSGIEWLGEIPAHWSVGRLGYYARVRNGSTPSRATADYWIDGTIPWLSSGKVNEWIVSEPSELITSRAVQETSLTVVPAGSVLVGMIGQGRTRGTTARLAIDACINQNMAAAVPGPALDGGFLHYFLAHAYEPLREFGRGGQQDALNCQILASFPVAVPPRTEQAAIASHIESTVEHEQRMRAVLERQLDRLREYRQALITAAVTGQLDATAESTA